ncbi:hypothetical protein SBX64_02965 [Vibrio rhizosphaerae]|uniref:Uncharacterized protein n=1 Tax=Vibrio rhizosphaerae TaxID=398736 RepID=A0ABU4IQ38_9VIBR|nr:hypothetical protein [Vibrio rhizosphaerae]MDW6091517.1 hypothetical protein [Vibrio rhizosphaerae]
MSMRHVNWQFLSCEWLKQSTPLYRAGTPSHSKKTPSFARIFLHTPLTASGLSHPAQ